MMDAASTFETSVNFYQTTRRNNPEGSHLLTLKPIPAFQSFRKNIFRAEV
jgi:hypothetical protein